MQPLYSRGNVNKISVQDKIKEGITKGNIIAEILHNEGPLGLIPIAEMLEPPKTQIAKWAGRTAKQGHHAVAAELYEMAGEHVKGAEAAGRAGMHLWAARLYAKAGLNRAALEARLKARRT